MLCCWLLILYIDTKLLWQQRRGSQVEDKGQGLLSILIPNRLSDRLL